MYLSEKTQVTNFLAVKDQVKLTSVWSSIWPNTPNPPPVPLKKIPICRIWKASHLNSRFGTPSPPCFLSKYKVSLDIRSKLPPPNKPKHQSSNLYNNTFRNYANSGNVPQLRGDQHMK